MLHFILARASQLEINSKEHIAFPHLGRPHAAVTHASSDTGASLKLRFACVWERYPRPSAPDLAPAMAGLSFFPPAAVDCTGHRRADMPSPDVRDEFLETVEMYIGAE